MARTSKRESKRENEKSEKKNPKKRNGALGIMAAILIILAAIALIHVCDMLLFGKWIRPHEIVYRSEKVPASLDGYRIALINDTQDVTAQNIEGFCDYLDYNTVDIILLGGDHEARKPGDYKQLTMATKRIV